MLFLQLLYFLVLFSSLPLILGGSPPSLYTIRVGFLGSLVSSKTLNFYSPSDGGVSQLQKSMIPLAAAIFNERRGDLIPALSNLKCNKNISVSWMCNDQGSSSRAFQNTLELTQLPSFPHFFIGPETSTEAVTVALVAASQGSIPVISNYATSPELANPALYPTFTRTIPSDLGLTVIAARFLKTLGYGRAALVYEGGTFGSGIKESLFTQSLSLNFDLKFQAYATGDYLSMENAFLSVKQTQFNVIFIVLLNSDLTNMAKAWNKTNMESQAALPILLGLSSVQYAVAYSAQDDNLAVMLNGGLMLSLQVPQNDRFSNFKKLFTQGYFSKYTQAINDALPPNGLGNSPDGCANWAAKYPLQSPAYLNGSASNLIDDSWAWSFDTVIAGGLAMCNLFPDQPLPQASLSSNVTISVGKLLYQHLMNLDFAGLSGQVNFDNETGDRNPLTSSCSVYNFVRVAPNRLAIPNVAVFNATASSWTVNRTVTVFKTGSSLPLETVPPVENMNYLPLGVKILGYVETAFLSILCLVCMAWLWIKRKTPVVNNAQGQLLIAMCFGCFVASWAIFALTADDSPDDSLNEDACCMAAPILFTIGFQIALLAVIGKLHRIYMLFQKASSFTKYNYPIHRIMVLILVILLGEIIILILWICLAPLTFSRVVLQTDLFGNPIETVGECVGSNASVAFVVIIFVFHGAGIIATGVYSSFVKNLPEKYQESKFINFAVLSMAQIYVISVPSFIAVYGSPIGRFILASSVVFITVIVLTGFMILPKVFPSRFDPPPPKPTTMAEVHQSSLSVPGTKNQLSVV